MTEIKDGVFSAIIRDIRADIRATQRSIKQVMRETNHDSAIKLKVYTERLEVYRDCLKTVKNYVPK